MSREPPPAAPRRLSALRGLAPFLHPYRAQVALAFVLLCLGSATILVVPLAFRDLVALRHRHAREVSVERREAEAVVEHDAVAVDPERPREQHAAGVARRDLGAGQRGEVVAVVRGERPTPSPSGAGRTAMTPTGMARVPLVVLPTPSWPVLL